MRTYPSKLLLFGEYTVLSGSSALAVPLDLFSAQWKWQSSPVEQENGLRKVLAYIQTQASLSSIINVQQFEQDIAQGLYLYSTIPSGYGLGSSGAVCAAVLDRFGDQEQLAILSLHQIHRILKQLECCFHGSSSGIDPLVSYLQESVVLKNGSIQKSNFQFSRSGDIHVYLFDSLHKREAACIISDYKKRLQEPEFLSQIQFEVIPQVESCIQYTEVGDGLKLWNCVDQLSKLQMMWMQAMIHEEAMSPWENSLQDDNVVFKLCGAGGGGFYLVFSKNSRLTRQEPMQQYLFAGAL